MPLHATDVSGIAKGMSPSEQMTAAAAIIRLPRRMSQPEGGPQVAWATVIK